MFDQLRQTRFFVELNRRATQGDSRAARYRGQIESSFEDISAYLAEIRQYFRHFTDHCVTHSIRILDRMGRLLCGQLGELSNVELYLFIASCLVHDIGMVVSESDVEHLRSDHEFMLFRDEVFSRIGLTPERFHAPCGLDRIIIADYFRRQHGRRCALKLDTKSGPCRQLTNADMVSALWIATVSEGHTLDGSAVLNEDRYPVQVEVNDETANVRFLTFCLRIGDLLDITTRRASPILRQLAEPLSTLSASHWDQYTGIQVRGLSPGQTIKIAGTCPTQDAERILRQWVKWLQNECEQAVTALNCGEARYKLPIGRIEYAVRPELRDGQPAYEFHEFRFNLDEERVFERLFGRRLYGRADVAVRELIQNGLDATKVRVAIEASRNGRDVGQSRAFAAHFAQRANELHIEVALEAASNDSLDLDKGRVWLRVIDQGIGMSRDAIEKYLLKVGRSRWREDPLTKELNVSAVGEFGIGFLSTFMVSDRTIIETQSCLPSDPAIRATIYSWQGYLATEPLPPRPPGTSVSLLLKKDASFALDNLTSSLSYWCPFLQLPLRIRVLDKVVEIPVKYPTVQGPKGGLVIFEFGSGPSLAVIEEAAKVRQEAGPPSVCQDGFVVAEVPPPILERADQQVLRWHGIRVDLRGQDKVPLDLSRNAFEGGAEELWEKLVPMIWEGIVNNGLRFSAGRDCLREYVQREFDSSRGSRLLVTSESRELRIVTADHRSIIDWLGAAAEVVMADPTDKRVSRLLTSEKCAVVFLPDVPFMLLDAWEMDDVALEYAKPSGYWAGLANARRNTQFNDEGHPATVLSDLVLRRVLPTIIESYESVVAASDRRGRLVRGIHDSGRPLDQLGFWRMSPNWYAIRSPVDNSWHALHFSEVEDIEKDAGRQLQFVEFIFLILADLWPSFHTWKGPWGLVSNLEELGGKFSNAKARAEGAEELDTDATDEENYWDDGGDDYDDGDDDFEPDEYDPDLGITDSDEDRYDRRLYVRMLLDDVFVEGGQSLKSSLTSWDEAVWSSGEWWATISASKRPVFEEEREYEEPEDEEDMKEED